MEIDSGLGRMGIEADWKLKLRSGPGTLGFGNPELLRDGLFGLWTSLGGNLSRWIV